MNPDCYIKHFSNLLPLSDHCSYCPEMEHSDKIIVPLSVHYEIQIFNIPNPPIFLLLPEKPKCYPKYCSILNYTAE